MSHQGSARAPNTGAQLLSLLRGTGRASFPSICSDTKVPAHNLRLSPRQLPANAGTSGSLAAAKLGYYKTIRLLFNPLPSSPKHLHALRR